MKLITPDVEYWKQGYTEDAIWKHIAKCMRVCYQSEKKKLDESEKDFVNRVVLHNYPYTYISKNKYVQNQLHLSVLEHGTIYLTTPRIEEVFNRYSNNPYSDVIIDIDQLYITTNMRVLIEKGWMEDLQWLSELTEHTPRITFSIYTNIGGIRDTNRHRVQSISEESTRYCRYSSPKFNSEIAIAKLPWISDDEYHKAEFHTEDLFNNGVISAHDTNTWNAVDWYMWYEQMCEIVYTNLNRLGWTAQQCSNVLTFSTKTQSVHTAFLDDWKHYCLLRSSECSGKVRPEVKLIANKIKNIIDTYES